MFIPPPELHPSQELPLLFVAAKSPICGSLLYLHSSANGSSGTQNQCSYTHTRSWSSSPCIILCKSRSQGLHKYGVSEFYKNILLCFKQKSCQHKTFSNLRLWNQNVTVRLQACEYTLMTSHYIASLFWRHSLRILHPTISLQLWWDRLPMSFTGCLHHSTVLLVFSYT
jgi:hypothetical protein